MTRTSERLKNIPRAVQHWNSLPHGSCGLSLVGGFQAEAGRSPVKEALELGIGLDDLQGTFHLKHTVILYFSRSEELEVS